MVMEEISSQILKWVKEPLYHPSFYIKIFALVSQVATQKAKLSSFSFLFQEDEALFRGNDRAALQESVSIRNHLFSCHLSQLLIDERGELSFSLLSSFREALTENLYSMGPQGSYDALRAEHILRVLKELQENKVVLRLIKKVTRPVANRWVEELIKITLRLPPATSITDAHARQAVLAAWLSLLRQNVGSCFATAPAEIIQSEQPERFLQDVSDLLATGQLKRTFGGVEYSVPMCASFGLGELRKPIFLDPVSQGTFPELWGSIGLMAAFEAAHLLEKEQSTQEKIRLLEAWIKPLFLEKIQQHVRVVTAEEIIQDVLMQRIGVSEKELRQYQARTKSAFPGSLILVSERSGHSKSKEAIFGSLFESAKLAFKAVADNALLKVWEFTLASFCDTQQEFSKWNLYVSLGLRSDEKGGVGECIHRSIQEKLTLAHNEAEAIEREYERAYTECKIAESRWLQASSEKEGQWLRIDYQSKKSEFYFVEEQRELAKHRSFALVQLYETLYPLYIKLFKDYFQEVYDPEMQEISASFFDDSPAGFRLLYKHGRSHSSQWTRIFDADGFVESLVAFFVATEPIVAASLQDKAIEKDLSEVITALVTHIRTKTFLESAFDRIALAHGMKPVPDPLNHLEKIEKKPWCYTSGGTMNRLVSCYYRLEDKPHEVQKWIESEVELVTFLADALKQIPPSMLDPFLEGKRSSLLMESPTHAFLLKPLLSPFREMWQNDEFTYTHIRDRYILPARSFCETLILDERAVRYLIEQFAEKIPRHVYPTYHAMFQEVEAFFNPRQFRDYFVDKMERESRFSFNKSGCSLGDEVDQFLYTHLPLTPVEALKERLSHLLSMMKELSLPQKARVLALFDEAEKLHKKKPFVGAVQLQEIAKALICLELLQTRSSFNCHLSVTQIAQELGYAMPKPLIFGDSNWVKDFFGFTINPGNSNFELWRFDPYGSIGFPMSCWKQWVRCTSPESTWGIYNHPYEYG